MLVNTFTLHIPKTLAQASELYGNLENVKIQAGGTFLLNTLKLMKRKGSRTPEHVLSLHKIPELTGIEATKDKFVIRAMTTIDELFESPLLIDNLSILRTVCRNISTQPIRNMATVGGNLTCRYTWTEMPAVMIALEAQMHFMDSKGKEEVISAEEFFQQAAKTDKIFTHVTIKRDKNACFAYQRVRKTLGVDIPLLSLLIKTTFQNNKFTNTHAAINNCVTFAQRDRKLEDFLNTQERSDKVAQEALDHLDSSIYDKRSDDYKKHMFRVSIKKAVEQLAQIKT